MKKNILIISIIFASFVAKAQLTIMGEIRPRSEYRNGFKTLKSDSLGDVPAFFVEQRSRLYFDYKNEKYVFRIALQDIRIWGQTSQIFKSESPTTTFLSEAWAQLNFTPKISLKVGRQIISYDNQRFLGGLEWAQQGRRHDAALLIYNNKDSKLKAHLGVAFNQDNKILEPKNIFGTEYIALNNYKIMNYFWVNKKFNTGSISFLAFNQGYEYYPYNTSTAGVIDTLSSKLAYQQTFGLVFSKNINDEFKIAGEGYFQTGKSRKDIYVAKDPKETQDVQAFMFDLNLTYKLDIIPITIGYQYLSGTDTADNKDDKIKHFNPAFGTNHMYNGFMDYFFVGNGHGNVGLQDIYFKTNLKLGKKSSLKINAHSFLSAVDIKKLVNGKVKKLSTDIGTEIDIVYTYKFTPSAKINIGYSHMFASESMEVLKGRGEKGTIQNWSWVMITLKPKLFEGKAQKN